MGQKTFWHGVGVPLALFAFALWFYLAIPPALAPDSVWVIPTAQSIVFDGDLELSEYRAEVRRNRLYGVRFARRRTQIYNFFPPGAALAISPLVWAINQIPLSWSGDVASLTGLAGGDPRRGRYDLTKHRGYFERLFGSLLTALAVVVVFGLARELLSLRAALAAALLFAFGTSALSLTSRALWQHGPSMLLVSVALWAMLRARNSVFWLVVAGSAASFAYVVRPTNALTVVAFGVLSLYTAGRRGVLYVLGMVAVLGPFVLWSVATYGRMLPPYYRGHGMNWSLGIFEAMAANLVSPSRGLLIFSPFLVLAPVGWFLMMRRDSCRPFMLSMGAICAGHLIAVSAFDVWWAGHTFGPRFMSDLLPYLCVMVGGAFAYGFEGPSGLRRIVAVVGCVILGVLSFTVHLHGAACPVTQRWNTLPVNIDSSPGRVWSVRDAQVLRGFPNCR